MTGDSGSALGLFRFPYLAHSNYFNKIGRYKLGSTVETESETKVDVKWYESKVQGAKFTSGVAFVGALGGLKIPYPVAAQYNSPE
jgi:hypothetical protein